MNLPITAFLICSNTRVALRKLEAKDESKINTLTAQILYLLHSFEPHVEITFVWTPEHSGNIGHDIVDKMTKVDPQLYFPLITPTSIEKYIRRSIKSSWEIEWYNSSQKLRELKTDTHT